MRGAGGAAHVRGLCCRPPRRPSRAVLRPASGRHRRPGHTPCQSRWPTPTRPRRASTGWTSPATSASRRGHPGPGPLRPGSRYDEATVDQDIRAIYEMGFFDDVEADLSQDSGQWVLTYRVLERPFIREVRIEGNKKLSREDLEAALKVRRTRSRSGEGPRGIAGREEALREEGLSRRQDRLHDRAGRRQRGHADVRVDEGQARAHRDDRVRGQHRPSAHASCGEVMQTKEKWFLSFLTGAGNLDHEVLKTDTERLTAFYYDNGYINVRIDEPVDRRARRRASTSPSRSTRASSTTSARSTSAATCCRDMSEAREQLELAPGEIFRASKLREDINSSPRCTATRATPSSTSSPTPRSTRAEKTRRRHLQDQQGPGGAHRQDRDHRQHQDARQGDPPRAGASRSSGASPAPRLRRSQERCAASASSRTSTSPRARRTRGPAGPAGRRQGGVDRLLHGRRRRVSSGESVPVQRPPLRRSTSSAAASAWSSTPTSARSAATSQLDFTEPYFLDTQLTAGVEPVQLAAGVRRVHPRRHRRRHPLPLPVHRARPRPHIWPVLAGRHPLGLEYRTRGRRDHRRRHRSGDRRSQVEQGD